MYIARVNNISYLPLMLLIYNLPFPKEWWLVNGGTWDSLPLLSTVSLIIGLHHALRVSLGDADFGHELAYMSIIIKIINYVWFSSVPPHRVPSLVRETAVVVCVTVLCYLAGEYLKLYQGKTLWYQFSQLLPAAVSTTTSFSPRRRRKYRYLRSCVYITWLADGISHCSSVSDNRFFRVKKGPGLFRSPVKKASITSMNDVRFEGLFRKSIYYSCYHAAWSFYKFLPKQSLGNFLACF